jgi:hypothetical protein
MRRLLWKEFQERAPWLLLWLLTVILTAAFGKGQALLSIDMYLSGWQPLSVLMAALAGLSAYGSEVKGERAAFLLSRAVTWPQVLLAKVLPGLGVAVIAPLLGALVGYFFLSAPYQPFATSAVLGSGALMLMVFTVCAYLIGLSCSVILPGMMGGVLVIMIWFAAVCPGLLLMFEVLHQQEAFAIFISALIAPVVAGLVLIRFGVTLPPLERLRRFLLVLGLVLLIGVGLEFTPPLRQIAADHQPPTESQIILAPGGVNAFAEILSEDTKAKPHSRYCWLRLPEMRRLSIKIDDRELDFYNGGWITPDLLYMLSSRVKSDARDEDGNGSTTRTDPQTVLLWWQDGQVQTRRIPEFIQRNDPDLLLSPDNRKLLIGDYQQLRVLDLRSGASHTLLSRTPEQASKNRRGRSSRPAVYTHCWWQSNDVVGYLEPGSERRMLVKLPEAE